MQLNMYIDGVLVDSMEVFPSADYKVHVDWLKYQLLEKHGELIATSEVSPQFMLEGVPSKMNGHAREPLQKHFDNNPLFPKSKKHKE
ncbi:MAG TPA: hypothetical protein VGE66_11035 [Chitinophagaceae bacterium]